MKKIVVLSLAFFLFFLGRAEAETYAPHGGKVILIDQSNQEGKAYENGKLFLSFPILGGDIETPTGNGRYRVEKKIRNYYSKRYQVPMPYSLFFIFNDRSRKAVHEGDVPKKKADRQRKWATHGCVHVEMPIMKKLYAWADENTTEIIVFGQTL
jgi:hypothetical protein